jgi:serine/threonine protein kinase
VNELSGYVFSPLREGDVGVHRGSGNGLSPILLVSADENSPGSVERLEHEFALKSELDADWAARPIALTHHNGRMTLVLEDRGGAPLDRLLGRPLEVSHFLRIAIPLVGVLRRVHERGLIHRDVKPANILVDVAGGGVWLTGFGIASRLPRERQAPAPPQVIAGTLAYMAPEQTGRMNRSVDSRSDLYALGITFYEMLTGQLPFSAADPIEWVHCHIARQPMPPDEQVAGVPGALSATVMKLLAKTAEERYQTAAGVGADLRRCLAEWESHGRIELFPLGADDVSDRLLIPEKLYGREPEIETLIASFDRVVATSTVELVLVSGYSEILFETPNVGDGLDLGRDAKPRSAQCVCDVAIADEQDVGMQLGSGLENPHAVLRMATSCLLPCDPLLISGNLVPGRSLRRGQPPEFALRPGRPSHLMTCTMEASEFRSRHTMQCDCAG